MITNLCDEDSELVEVAEAVWTDSQLTDNFIELLCSFHRILRMYIYGISERGTEGETVAGREIEE